MPNETMLEVKDLKKYFKTPRGMLHAVDGVNFRLEKGKTLGVVGESGCGKSTLGRTILHLLEPTAGSMVFKGRDISNPGKEEIKTLRREMQMIFQDPYSSIDPRMNVGNLIEEPLRVHKIGNSETDRKDMVNRIMEVVGLAPRLRNAYPHELDGGRRQRIGIARALILNPEFIVCDEPVSALDVSIQAQILNLMQDLQEERELTYIFITHDLSVVKHISDQICVMYLGMVVEMCSAGELFRRQWHPYTKALLSAIPIPSVMERKKRILLSGEISSPIEPGSCCRFAKRCPHACDECRQKTPALREVEPGHFCACHFAEKLAET